MGGREEITANEDLRENRFLSYSCCLATVLVELTS